MMKRYYATITPSNKGRSMSIDQLIDELESYKKTLNRQIELFLNRLLDVGISIAESNSGTYGRYIIFEKKVNVSESEYVGILNGRDAHKVFKEWQTRDGTDGYEISPILMAEFGSGWLAQVLGDVQGVGQGTMPNAKGHANDPKGWYWKDDDGWHHSFGEAPTMPMHRASVQMLVNINRIAHEVFGNG